MRRPLLQPDGTPLVQPAGPAVDTLFDVNDLDPTYTYAVTVFCWYPQGDANNVSIGVATDGGPVLPTALFPSAGDPIDAFRANGIGPAKVMDRFVVRGNQQIVVAAISDFVSPVAWWGYIERAGIAPMPAPYLPLRPTALSGDFSAPPTFIFIPFNASPPTVTQTIHMLDGSDERRMDLLDLYVACTASTTPGSVPVCTLKMPGGVDMDIPVLLLDAGGQAGSPIHFYDRIPVRAPSTTDNLFQLEVLGATGADVTAVAYGRYCRS